MPLNETEIFKEDTMDIEHSGGDGWTILHGDTLKIMRRFKPQVFDAVITDPPYSCLLYTSRCV